MFWGVTYDNATKRCVFKSVHEREMGNKSKNEAQNLEVDLCLT